MRRAFAIVLILLMTTVVPVSAYSQASRYRIDTHADKSGTTPAPSFRGKDFGHDNGNASEALPSTMMQQQYQTGQTSPMVTGYQVHVLGEVRRPGTYRLPASGRLSDAIMMAGGLAENGSERRIELKRGGRRVQTVDLLRFKLFGSLANNPYLLDNDVVFVPLREKVVEVVGAVKRPKIYELRGEKNLADVIKLAGGFNAATAKNEPVRVIRYENGQKAVETVSINASQMKAYVIKAGDVIVVPNVVTKETEFDYNVAAIPGDQVFYPSYEDRVFVLGGVQFPGAYPFSPYYTVNQYISLAGGVSEKGKERYRIINARGESRRADENDRVNPGDTIAVKQRWMTPAGWAAFALGVASFGLSASATIIAISK